MKTGPTSEDAGPALPSTTEGPDPEAESPTVQRPADPVVITAPGVYDGMSDEIYHGDPVEGESLSHSGMKTLLDAPARYRHERDNGGRPPKAHFDFGHAAHAYVLGVGSRIAVIDAENWKSPAVRAKRDQARALGLVPLLVHEDAKARKMAAAVRANPRVGHLFEPGRGVAERALFWFDETFGFWRRAKLDWTTRLADGRLAIVDYKSRDGKVDGDGIGRALWEFGYYTQDPYYRDGVEALGLDEDPVFLFVFQEKTDPFLVTVAEMDAESKAWGRLKVRQGLDTYARCMDTGVWPDYMVDGSGVALPPGTPLTVGLPRWADFRLTDEYRSGRLDIE